MITPETDARWPKSLDGDGDIVIVGAGLAGLYTALKLSPRAVTVVAAAALGKGASSVWAQGGMAAAVDEGDTPQAHAADTIASGAGLVDETLALSVAKEAPDCIHDLLSLGVPFDRDLAGRLKVSKEAAHSTGRVVRVSGDRAGGAIMAAVIETVRNTPSIRVLEGYHVDDLVADGNRVTGVRLRDASGANFELAAKAIVLATGGIGGLYEISTNPAYARGEAIAMAARAGAIISDAEFVQFHPTALDIDKNPAPLATEALRGEGATLINDRGERFLLTRDPRAELASRDIVAQGVAEEIAAGRRVYLDCRTAIGNHFVEEFPTVYKHCRDAGIDPAIDLIPVAPAQHYHMGGIATGTNGRTHIAGLWAIGEAAATGLHGANRLASNSLLEAVVFGARTAGDVRQLCPDTEHLHPAKLVGRLQSQDNIAAPVGTQVNESAINELRRVMTRYVGVSRKGAELRKALEILSNLERKHATTSKLFANMVLTARFIATAAYVREESRGAQVRRDFPDLDPALAKRSMLTLKEINAVTAKLGFDVDAKTGQATSKSKLQKRV